MQVLSDFDPLSQEYARQNLAGSVAPTMAFTDVSGETVRRQIARELHDTVIQPLTALVMGLRLWPHASAAVTSADHIGACQALAQEALDALRATLAGQSMHPHDRLGLPEAVRQRLIPQFRRLGLELQVESINWPLDLPSGWTSNLFLAVREAVTNAEKHGHASQVSIHLWADTQHLEVSVVDNGSGFAPLEVGAALPARPGGGLGLQGIYDRMTLLGGRLLVAAGPGLGTHIKMWIPVPEHMLPPGPGLDESGRCEGTGYAPVH